MPVIEPVVNEEKLRLLLSEQCESSGLDFKSELDVQQTAALVELAKDIGAMQLEGGYIVIGADETGNPTGRLTPPAAKLLDEARLRPALARYLDTKFRILTATHHLNGAVFTVIYVAPNPDGLAIFESDGDYMETSASGKQQRRTVFRRGEVFVRHGTSSERWRQDDMARIRAAIESRAKEAWRREYAAALGGEAMVGRQIVEGPASAITWELDDETFEGVVVELLRRKDMIPVRLLFEGAAARGRQLRARVAAEEISAMVARITAAASLGLRLNDSELWGESLRALNSLYAIGVEEEARSSRTPDDLPRFYLQVLAFVYALGGLAVRLQRWSAVRELAVARADPPDREGYWPTWLRHGLTQAARAGALEQITPEGRRLKLSLIDLARKTASEHSYLHPDVPPDDERIVSSVCQFDILAALAAIDEGGQVAERAFYTNFARYYTHRTEPAVIRLITDRNARSVLFRGSDQLLAEALRRVDSLAQGEAFAYDGWDGFTDQRIRDFLHTHPSISP